MSLTPLPLAVAVEAALRRLRLVAIRGQAPEVMAIAKAQRWTPEEVLRVLIEVEIASRDSSNCRNRMTAARFPIDKTLDEFHLAEYSIPRSSHDYLITLEWIHHHENMCLVGPAGDRQTPYLIGLGLAAVTAGHRVRYSIAVELVGHLYCAVADNTVGKAIENVCRNDLIIINEISFAPLDHTGCQLLFRLVDAAYERRSIVIGSHSLFNDWADSCPTNPPPSRCSIGSATTPTSSPRPATATDSPTEPPERRHNRQDFCRPLGSTCVGHHRGHQLGH